MSRDFFQARGSLKARWLAVNKRALEYRRKAAAAEKEAAVLQRELDTLEGAADGLIEGEPVPRGRRTDRQNTVLLQLIEELKVRGPTTAPELAKALGLSYWSTLSYLKRGPYKVTGTVQNGKRQVQVWAPDGAAEAPVAAASEGSAEGE